MMGKWSKMMAWRNTINRIDPEHQELRSAESHGKAHDDDMDCLLLATNTKGTNKTKYDSKEHLLPITG